MHQCPYCHSLHITLLRQTEPSSGVFAKLSSFSPMSLAAACMQLSKRSPVHPSGGWFCGLGYRWHVSALRAAPRQYGDVVLPV